jgi:hypothetical protein
MKIIDLLVDMVQKAIRSPEQEKEILYFLLVDLSLKSKSISERKAWMTLALLVSRTWSDRKFPSDLELKKLKSQVNRDFRNNETRTSSFLFTLEDFEMGEAAVKKFLHERAWKGLAGFEEDGSPSR